MKLTRRELIDKYIAFFESKGHKRINSASVIPTNDATVLFTTAGMHPLVPFLLGESHPSGKRLVNVQKCVRTNDIDSVGDMGHCTFFEMLGNWSLGDYFKKDAIAYSYEFLTSPKYLGFDKNQLAVTVFAGEGNIQKDEESYNEWLRQGISADHIFYLGKEDNWWGLGAGTGPCGPDTEMFIDTGKPKCGADCNPSCKCGKYLEIWNDVFMQYVIENVGDSPKPLSQKNVDTGMGVERVLCMKNGLSSVYETEIFLPAIGIVEELSGQKYSANSVDGRAMRIIVEHLRSATMIIGDEIETIPSNVGRGYVVRRLIRRAVNYAMGLNIDCRKLDGVVNTYIDIYASDYPSLHNKRNRIVEVLLAEIEKFEHTITAGYKEFEKAKDISQNGKMDGAIAFRLYDTYGFPIELTRELSAQNGLEVDEDGYAEAFARHQELSRTASAGAFKGGLADTGVETVRLHTAAHLMLAAMRKLLGDTVTQKGSNITAERLRFDFSFDRKLTDEEVLVIENMVNDAIKKDIKVECAEMSLDKARSIGAHGVFDSKYNDLVKVYTVEGVSCEICGGPHASRTGELGTFKIEKQEACSAGVRRVKAVLK